MNRLKPTTLKLKPEGLHHDGGGLYLQVKNDARSWLYRYSFGNKSRWMGLGPYPTISLADARKAAAVARKLRSEGTDPIEARRQRRQAAQLEAAHAVTFETCADRYIEGHKAGWRNSKHAAQWSSTLTTYAYPIFGSLPVHAVDTGCVLRCLEPIWNSKPETASRVRQRIEAVLDWATARGYRNGDNAARWRGHLDKLLPKRSKVSTVHHHEAMPYTELPSFFEMLLKRTTISARALAFTILTAARSGEVRGATVDEIDFQTKVWTIPGERTKSGREHRVPLTEEALTLLKALADAIANGHSLLFPNPKGKALSDAAIRKYLQEDLGQENLTVHGFRSTFRDWAAERTNFPRELAEAALAHVLRDKTEAAYQRGDMLDRRRKLMEAWTKFCISHEATKGRVVPMRKARNEH